MSANETDSAASSTSTSMLHDQHGRIIGTYNPHDLFSRASRSTTDRTLRRTGGRPDRPRRDSRAQRRRTMSRCHRKIVAGATISRIAASWLAGSVPASVASHAWSGHVNREPHGLRYTAGLPAGAPPCWRRVRPATGCRGLRRARRSAGSGTGTARPGRTRPPRPASRADPGQRQHPVRRTRIRYGIHMLTSLQSCQLPEHHDSSTPRSTGYALFWNRIDISPE